MIVYAQTCQEVSEVMSSISSFKLVLLWLSWSKVPQRGRTSEQKEGVFRRMSLLISETKSNRLSNHLKMSRRRGNNDTFCWGRWHSIAKSKAESSAISLTDWLGVLRYILAWNSVLVFPICFLSVLHSGWFLSTRVCPKCTVWICINQTCRCCNGPVFHLFHWSTPLVCFSLSYCLFFHSVCSAVEPTQQILPFKLWALSCRIPTCYLSEFPHLCWNSPSIDLFYEKKWKC